MGTVSGAAGGLAATDPKLVPYGALTVTFQTGISCLVGRLIQFLTARFLIGRRGSIPARRSKCRSVPAD